MDRNLGPSGIEGLGNLPRGTHFCLFYETKQDLIETLLGFFKAGLENHEFCLWITSDRTIEEARNAFQQAISDADQHLEAGDIKILTYQQWYLTEDAFDPHRVIHNWNEKLAEAKAHGYSGVRAAGDEGWLDRAYWDAFSVYEAELDQQLAHKNILVICAYPTMGRSASEILDIARTHNFVAAKRQGNWEILESPSLMKSKLDFQKRSEEPQKPYSEATKFRKMWRPRRSALLSYGVAVLSVIAATLILSLMRSGLQAAAHVSMFLCAVLLSAWFGGSGPGLLALVLSMLSFVYFYLPPTGSLSIESAQLSRLLLFAFLAIFILLLNAARKSTTESLKRARDDLKRNIQVLQAEIVEHLRTEKELRDSEERLRALSSRLVETRDTERRTIARKLHDEVGQMLTGLQLTLKMSSRLPPDAARARLEEAQKLTGQLLDRVQDLSLDLRPAMLDDLGLAPALLGLFERYTHQTSIRVRFDHRGIDRRFPSEIETAAYQIIQEGLTNVARHAGVTEAAVRVWAENGTLGIQVEDKGEGFDVETALKAHTSSGLSGIQEQAGLLGGQVTIESSSQAGTLITVELPLRYSQERGQNERDDIAGG